MESGRGNGGVMRGGPGGKKMRKRKELDALVGGVGVKRGNGGCKRPGSGGVSPQDQLLSESTGEEEYWSSAKGGGGKGRKPYRTSHGKRRTHACTALLRLCTILLVMACVVATITVMWLFIDIKEQTTYLRSQLDQVSAGNKGIPESLQGYHTLTRELQKNQTKINEDLIRVAFQLSNFSNVMSTMQSDLVRVQKKLEDSQPRLNDPSSLQTLTTSVASFKDQIDELQSKAISISDEQIKIRTLIASLNSNMTDLSKSVQELRNHTEDSQSHADIVTEVLNKVQPELDYLNKTLSTRVKWYDDILPVQRMVSDTSDKIKVVQSLIETMRGDLLKQNDTITVIQSDFNNATVEWNILMRDMKILQSNMSRFIANCSQCRYEQPFTDIPAVLTSEISNNASYITADDRET